MGRSCEQARIDHPNTSFISSSPLGLPSSLVFSFFSSPCLSFPLLIGYILFFLILHLLFLIKKIRILSLCFHFLPLFRWFLHSSPNLLTFPPFLLPPILFGYLTSSTVLYPYPSLFSSSLSNSMSLLGITSYALFPTFHTSSLLFFVPPSSSLLLYPLMSPLFSLPGPDSNRGCPIKQA